MVGVKVFFVVLAFVLWATYWSDRWIRHDWPTWLCFTMMFALPAAVEAELLTRYLPRHG